MSTGEGKDYVAIALKYCDDVKNGVILANQLVMSACTRHLDDLEKVKDPDYLYEFNDGHANFRCKFSENFKHVKGKWAGTPIELEPHQVFIQCCIWGWVWKKNGLRRFTTAYLEIPRKNGKSVDGALTGLYMVAADEEKGAEVYSGASTEKQALEVFRPAWAMAQKNSIFLDFYGISLSGTPKNPTSLYKLGDMSRFELVIGNPGDGASPHAAVIDEFHEHKSSDQYDTMDTGMGAREQPLMYVITTAGDNLAGPCYEMHLKAIKILQGDIEDDNFFTIIFTIDKDDDYQDWEVWEKANPNYGVSINRDYLKRKYKETLNEASKQNVNLRKHLNVWTNAGTAWMNMVKWGFCADTSLKLENFKGTPCYVGLDLASKIDICALTLLFEFNGGLATFGKYYLPEETVNLPGNDHYVKWVKEGHITQTPGARTDFFYIEEDLKRINDEFPMSELAFDPRESGYLINNIMEWYDPDSCIEITQGPAQMSQPMKELEALVYSKGIWHDGDPVLGWMLGNVVKKQGRNTGPVKYYYPTKETNALKIDGAISLIMAVGRAMLHTDHMQSAYDGLDVDGIKARMMI